MLMSKRMGRCSPAERGFPGRPTAGSGASAAGASAAGAWTLRFPGSRAVGTVPLEQRGVACTRASHPGLG